ncbi:TIGR01777 family oxidoreductase [Paenibacillus sp. FSL W8-0186]|uniref:Epimerase n=1 Tax=Paenibacillus woosongensis TaxID=307580 RepID=A0ABQ4MML9_9BACL|nr:TIGR01777 family oxidoreductase [Paenibacillus woosongensis]GIP57246.1 epimerase [Paenibacillus woosongensis]
MKIYITGGTGFIGNALASYWQQQGHHVAVITRGKPEQHSQGDPKSQAREGAAPLDYLTWEQLAQPSSRGIEVDAVVNLAGTSLNQRWTGRAKDSILHSRLQTTDLTAKWVQSLNSKPEVIIQGSAVGIYGTSLTDTFDENSQPEADDFLANVTRQWETAAEDGFRGIRLVKLRTGVVLGNKGGAYPLMRLPILFGAGGKIGSGRQWVPWIHIQDIVALIDFCVKHSEVEGAVNAVSPNPVTNDEFGRIVSRVHRRPYWLPLPAFALRTMLGEMSVLLLEGQRVLPQAALQHGFHFQYPELESAAANLKTRQ